MRREESRIRQGKPKQQGKDRPGRESRSSREKTGLAGKAGCCPSAIRPDSINAIDSTDSPGPGGGS